MVDLTTTVNDLQDPSVNIRLGSFQKSGGNLVSALGEGVKAGIDTFDDYNRAQARVDAAAAAEQEADVNSELFDLIVGSEPVNRFDNLASRTAAKEAQKGRGSILSESRLRSELLRLKAEGIPEEILAGSMKKLTGKSIAAYLTELETNELDQRKAKIDYLNGQGIYLDPQTGSDLSNVGDPRINDLIARRQAQQLELERSNNALQLANNNESLSTLAVVDKYRTEVGPKQMQIVTESLQQITSRIDPEMLRIVPSDEEKYKNGELPLDEVRYIIDTGKIDPVELAALNRQIDQMENNFLEGNRYGLLNRLSTEEFNQAMSGPKFVFEQARGILNGTAFVDSLGTVDTILDAEAKHSVFRDNPSLRPALSFVSQVSPLLDELGLGGLTIAQQLESDVLVPALANNIVSFQSALLNAGVTDKNTQEAIIQKLGDAFTNSKYPLKARADALAGMLPSMLHDAEIDPNIFQAMIPFLADEETAFVVMEAITDPALRRTTRRQLQRGLADQVAAMEEALARDFQSRSEVLFVETLDVRDSDQREIVARTGRSSRFVTTVDVIEIVQGKDGLTLNRNTDILKDLDLSTEEESIINTTFEDLSIEWQDRLDDLSLIQHNFGVAFLGVRTEEEIAAEAEDTE